MRICIGLSAGAVLAVGTLANAQFDKKPIGSNELVAALIATQKSNPNLRVIISGDQDARHGDVIHALDLVRSAGIDKVAFEIQPAAVQNRGESR
jgi:biopolymer transport protein ExbD